MLGAAMFAAYPAHEVGVDGIDRLPSDGAAHRSEDEERRVGPTVSALGH